MLNPYVGLYQYIGLYVCVYRKLGEHGYRDNKRRHAVDGNNPAPPAGCWQTSTECFVVDELREEGPGGTEPRVDLRMGLRG